MSNKNPIGEVDLDKSSIEIGKEWMTTKELKSTIKTKIETGDFDVTLYAKALKKLESTLKSLEEVQLRMPVNVLNAYKNMADDESTSVESCLRKGVIEYLKHHDKLQPMDLEDDEDTGKKPTKGKRRSK
ncbi:MAG: hypothetical protein JSV49_07005 [Thermoplasmata archaeon]|nr:MAG: hypothetical protein JSV49_07005 [Thermoplasmata archaeon]